MKHSRLSEQPEQPTAARKRLEQGIDERSDGRSLRQNN
jgi:hypothetical protein